MNIKYKIVKDFTIADKEKLAKLNIEIHSGWDDFLIAENDNNYFAIKDYLKEDWDNIAEKTATFSRTDIQTAPYLSIFAHKMIGYPKPDTEAIVDNFESPFDIYPYYKDVFESAKIDSEYGMLKGSQIGCYKFKGEPKWGRSEIVSAHNVEDTFFVKPDIYMKIFKPLGIKCCPVLDYKTGKELKNIIQLIQQGVSESSLNITDENIEERIYIENWKLKKYILTSDNYYPSLKNNPGNYDFFYTQEYFGDGGYTQRNTLISNRLLMILESNKIKGLNYYPMMHQ